MMPKVDRHFFVLLLFYLEKQVLFFLNLFLLESLIGQSGTALFSHISLSLLVAHFLILKGPITTAADNIFIYFFYFS